jgi:hypothetical protein
MNCTKSSIKSIKEVTELFAFSWLTYPFFETGRIVLHDILIKQSIEPEIVIAEFASVVRCLVFVPLAAICGPIVGFFSNSPIFTLKFKITYGILILVSSGIFLLGIQNKDKIGGKILAVVGFWMIFTIGLLGFGPNKAV